MKPEQKLGVLLGRRKGGMDVEQETNTVTSF
jgi:hypothetical protein